MSNDTSSAVRVAGTIAAFKWIAVGGILLIGVIGFLGGLLSGDGSGFALGFGFLAAAAIYALVMWVLFGWFEQTLRMLASIAGNTASGYAPATTNPYS